MSKPESTETPDVKLLAAEDPAVAAASAGEATPVAASGSPAPRSEPPSVTPLIGIGAGDGATLKEFLASLPAQARVAWFVQQHVPHREDLVPASDLARACRLPVVDAAPNLAIEPDHVYVMPGHDDWSLDPCAAGQCFTVKPASADLSDTLPIDRLFRMLARAGGMRSMGVLLSGQVLDGAIGLDMIQGEGGVTLAQDDKYARNHEMPHQAISLGCVDFVLPLPEISKEIRRLMRHSYLAAGAPAQPEETPDEHTELERIFRILRTQTGVDFANYKSTTIKRRIARRMLLHHLESLGEYVKLFKEQPGEAGLLYRDLLINVTRFFRDPEVFDALKEKIFTVLTQDRPPETAIRIWVPGCASGEEAYSIAIALIEVAGNRLANFPIQIFGTDISNECIEKARQGLYPEGIALDVSPERLRRFFIRIDSGYQISKTVRDLCVFARQDLTKDPPFSRLDLISCRNLMIYLTPAAQRKAFQIFHYALKPGAFLLLGTSETVGSASEYFALEDKHCKIYSRKPTAAHTSHEFVLRSHGMDDLDASVGHARFEPPAPSVEQAIDRAVLAHRAPTGIVINDDFDIVHVRGHTGPYLEPAQGVASLNVQKMAREGLLLELRTAVHAARVTGRPVQKTGLHVEYNGIFRPVNLQVIPMPVEPGRGRHYLILFEEAQAAPGAATAASPSHERGNSPQDTDLVAQLRQELAATKEYLQSIIEEQEVTNEELRAANEETQSSNEELQSTNEEMETAKEELQSAVEELTTVNDELQNRNQELAQANNDLLNLIASVNFAIIMLGSDMRIRRFTPMAARVLNLIPGDIGRPLSDLSANIMVPNLEQAIWEVIETLSVKEQDVQDRDGHWYSMRIRPYTTKDHVIDGVVIAFVEIDALKRNIARLAEFKDFAEVIVEAAAEPILLCREDGQILLANAAFGRVTDQLWTQLAGRQILDVCKTWRREDIEALLTEVRSAGEAYLPVRTAHGRPSTVKARARRVGGESDPSRAFVLAFEQLAIPPSSDVALPS